MSVDIEYAIKKDVRNNPVVREVDPRQNREYIRTTWLVVAVVAMVLFAAWQRSSIVTSGYEMQRLQVQIAAEAARSRQLRLELETLRAPQRLERLALEMLHMQAPSPAGTLVIERAVASPPDQSAVASAR